MRLKNRDYNTGARRRIIVIESLQPIPYDRAKKTGFAAFMENHSSHENGLPNLNANPMLGHEDRRHYSPIMGNSCRRSGKFARRQVFLRIYLIGLEIDVTCS